MAGRAYMGEVLTQVWLKSVKLFDKEVNAPRESLKKIPGFMQAPTNRHKSVR